MTRDFWRIGCVALLLAGPALGQPAQQRPEAAPAESAPSGPPLSRRLCIPGPSDCRLVCPAPSTDPNATYGTVEYNRCLGQCLENLMNCSRSSGTR